MATPPLEPRQPATDTSDVFDRRALDMLHRLGGARLVRDMVNLFVTQGEERLLAARTGMRDADAAGVRAAAHALKSSAGQLGAVRLQRLCAELETAAAASLADIDQRLDAIDAELSRALQWLRDEAAST